MGGLTLENLVRAETASGKRSYKAVIMVYLSGGLAHQDSFDLKPEAPAEIRGEFSPIATSVPGMQVCELMPRLAEVMDRCSVIRSVVGQRDEHSSFQSLTGYTMDRDATGRRRRTSARAFRRRLGPTDPVIPPFVDLFPRMQHKPYNSYRAGYLRAAFDRVRADGEDLASMKLRFIESPQFQKRQSL